MTAQPDISIIIATLNCVDTIEHALSSCLEQTGVESEVLVADGLSNDGTVSVLESHSSQIAWWESSTDSGIYDAWNRAIKHARGQWILFIGADDFLPSSYTLREALAAISKDGLGNKKLLYASVDIINEQGLVRDRLGRPFHQIERQIIHGMPYHLPHSGMLHDRRFLTSLNGFDAQFRIAGDYDMIIRALSKDPHAVAFLDGITLLKKGDWGVSGDTAFLGIWETMCSRRKNGKRGITIPWLLILTRAWLRYLLKNLLKTIKSL